MLNISKWWPDTLVGIMFIMVLAVEGTKSSIPSCGENDYQRFGPYYMHDNSSSTTNIVNGTGGGLFPFGSVAVFDNLITKTKSINSPAVAHIQGFQVVVSTDGSTAYETSILVLPKGSLSFSGPIFTTQNVSRLSCVGGTGEYENVTRGYYEAILVDSTTGPNYNFVFKVTAAYHSYCK